MHRLARIEGHIRAIKTMADTGRDCSDLLLQIAAVQKALDATAKIILKDHMEQCVVSAIDPQQQDRVLKDLQRALEHYFR